MQQQVLFSEEMAVGRRFGTLIFLVHAVLLAGCKDTGGEIVGFVNGILNRPGISVSDVTINEGGSATVTIQLDRALSKASELSWSINAPSGELTESAGTTNVDVDATSATFTFQSVGNSTSDGHRSYTLTVSGSSLYFSNTATATVTVVDDESEPLISVANISITEGNSGSANAVFTVTLTGSTTQSVVVNYATANGSASAGSDYVATTGTLTIPAGNSTGTISVQVTADSTPETNETFTLSLSGGSGYTVSGSTLSATATIVDDDLLATTWNFSTPGDYTYDTARIDLSSGTKASLKTVNMTFNDSSTFNGGTHIGTTYAGGALKLDSTTASNTALASTWTPKWSSLIGYWKMDADWQDTSGNGNNGTAVDSPTISNSIVRVGSGSGEFAGTDYVSTSASGVNLSDFTVVGWAYPSTTGSHLTAFASSCFQFGFLPTSQLFFRTTDRTFNDGNNQLASISAWNHIAITKSGSTVKLYLNGLESASTTTAVDMSSCSLRLAADGLSGTGGLDSFQGHLDDFAVWNVTLSKADIGTIYNRQKQKYAGSYSSPIIDMGASGATWTSLTSVSPLPFYKELPGASGSESSSAYSAIGGSLMTNLIAYYKFNETSYNGTPGEVKDSSASNYGVAYSSAANSVAGGFLGRGAKAATLSGSNVFTTPNFTISIWVLPTSIGAGNLSNTILDILASSSAHSLVLALGQSSKVQLFNASDSSTTTSSKSVTQNSWNQVVLRFNGSCFQLFINGVKEATCVAGSLTAGGSTRIRLGTNFLVSANFSGTLDELAAWSRTLTDAEVLELYKRGANRVKYQVRSCVDSACACKSLSSAPAGSAADCDGDGILNANDTSDVHAADWLGPDGTASTYYSEHQNNSVVDSSGNPTGTVNTTGLALDWSGTFFTAAARPTANRYFQYRVYMESDDVDGLCSSAPCMPEVTSIQVGPTGRYYGGSPTIVNNTAISFSQLQTMTKSDSNSCTSYQLSIDGGSTWKWWNGSAWTNTTDGVSSSNAVSDFTTARLQSLSGGNYKFKVFLKTNSTGDFTQSCDLNTVGLTYTP